MLPNEALDRFFVAVADATEEAIVNALCEAETMTGYQGRTAHALPVDEVAKVLSRYRSL
jgi:D-aminopeptidase